MNNEFKKISKGDVTRYVLESGSSGGTSSGSVASVSMPMGGTRRRGDNLITQEADKKTIPTSTPRNFVAKNAKTSGAGAHKDKKKAAKQGQEKHKKPFMEDHTTASGGWGQGSYDTYTAGRHGRGVAEEDDTEQEVGMAGSELYGIAKHAKELLALIHQHGQDQGLEAWQQSKITKAADYLTAVLQSLDYDTNVEQGVEEGSLSELTDRLVNRVANRRSDNEIDARDNLDHNDPKTIAALQRSRENKIRSDYLNTTRDANKLANTALADPLKVAAARRDAEYRKYKAKETPIGGWEKMQGVAEEWSQKYKSSINCSHPKGFSQKAHCAGKKKHNESVEMEMVCPECGMCETHGNSMMEVKQRLDAKCWKGKHKEGTKIKGGVRVNNCVPNEGVEAEKNPHTSALGRALWRDLSKEKKASPQQVQRNKERWAQRQAEREPGVAEGSEIKIPTEDGITMQDIRLMAGEGPLTKKTVLQAIAVIRKQRRPTGVAEGSFGSGYGSVFTLYVNTGEKPATKTKTKKFKREDDAVLWAEDYADQHEMFPNLKMEIQDENGNVVWELEESQGVAEGETSTPAIYVKGGGKYPGMTISPKGWTRITDIKDEGDSYFVMVGNDGDGLNIPKDKVSPHQIKLKNGMPITAKQAFMMFNGWTPDGEQGVAEGVVDTVKKIGKKLIKPVEVPGLNQMKDIHNTVHKRELDAQNKKYAPKDVKGSMDTSEPAATGPSTDNYVAKEGAKVDRQAKHITASMMKKGKSKKDAESIAWAHIKHPKNESADTYFESLQTMMERQLEPNMDLDTWIDNFQNADPNKYHQFKHKTPEKKK